MFTSTRTALLVLLLAPFLHFVSASAAAQFGLDINSDISRCWLQCHGVTIALVHDWDSDPLGTETAIGGNCADHLYINAMPSCLLASCASAPDVAYAVEFGQRWCAKAGVDIRDTLKLPEDYTQVAAREYFESEAYLASGATPASAPVRSLVLTTGGAVILTLIAMQ